MDNTSKEQKNAEEVINNTFSWHNATEESKAKMAMIRGELKEIARILEAACPNSREKSLAMTHLEEVMFWANSSIVKRDPIAE